MEAPFPFTNGGDLVNMAPHSWNRSMCIWAAVQACPGEAVGSTSLWFGTIWLQPARIISFLGAAIKSKNLAQLAFSRTETQAPVENSGPTHIFTWIGRIKTQMRVFLSLQGVTKRCGLFPEKKQNPVSCLQAFKTLKLRSSVSQYVKTISCPNCVVG